MILTVSVMNSPEWKCWRCLRPLEPALQLPISDAAVVLELLPVGGMDVVVHDLLAEGVDQHFGLLERAGRVAQRLMNLAQLLAEIGIAGEGRFELELVLGSLES